MLDLSNKICPNCNNKNLEVSYYKDSYVCSNCNHSHLISSLNNNSPLRLKIPSIVMQKNLNEKFFQKPLSLLYQIDQTLNFALLPLIRKESKKSGFNHKIIKLDFTFNNHHEIIDNIIKTFKSNDLIELWLEKSCSNHNTLKISQSDYSKFIQSIQKLLRIKCNIIVVNSLTERNTLTLLMQQHMNLCIKTEFYSTSLDIEFIKSRYPIINKKIALSLNQKGYFNNLIDIVYFAKKLGIVKTQTPNSDFFEYVGNNNSLDKSIIYNMNTFNSCISEKQAQDLEDEVLKGVII